MLFVSGPISTSYNHAAVVFATVTKQKTLHCSVHSPVRQQQFLIIDNIIDHFLNARHCAKDFPCCVLFNSQNILWSGCCMSPIRWLTQSHTTKVTEANLGPAPFEFPSQGSYQLHIQESIIRCGEQKSCKLLKRHEIRQFS